MEKRLLAASLTVISIGFYDAEQMMIEILTFFRKLILFKVRIAAAAFALTLSTTSGLLLAQDEDFELMSEPTSYTDVVDAFDDKDPFDINIRIDYHHKRTNAAVQRYFTSTQVLENGEIEKKRQIVDVADYEHIQNVMNFGLDIGLYKDLAFFFNLPLILDDNRQLSIPSGLTQQDVENALFVDGGMGIQDPLNPGEELGDHQLFNMPFKSPTRSGLDHVALGLAYSIFNQNRNPNVPTWMIMAEGRIAVGDPLHACNDAQRYGDDFDTPNEVEDYRCNQSSNPGMSRGTHAFRFETRASQRFRYVEPYLGMGFQMEWAGPAKDQFTPSGDLEGYTYTEPPTRGEFTAGITIIPWENRENFQRFDIDLRVMGTYVSAGRDYTPLFDALGTSPSPYLRVGALEGIPQGDGNPLRISRFTGITDVEAHGEFSANASVQMRAARYVRFKLGTVINYTGAYDLTTASACNPNVNVAEGDPRQGLCSEGIINPGQRFIDIPGRRFRVGSSLGFDIYASAVAQF